MTDTPQFGKSVLSIVAWAALLVAVVPFADDGLGTSCALGQQPSDSTAVVARLVAEVEQSLQQNKLDEAADRLRAALEKHPRDANLRRKHIALYGAYLNAQRPQDALAQLADFVEYHIDEAIADRRPELAGLEPYIERLTAMYAELSQIEAGLAKLAAWQQQVVEANLNPSLLVRHRAMLLARAGRRDESEQVVSQVVQKAESAHKANPKDALATVEWLQALRLRRDVLRHTGASDAREADEQFAQAAKDAATQPGAASAVVALYVSDELARINQLVTADANAAEARLSALEQWINELPKEQAADSSRTLWVRSINAIKSHLERGKVHAQLIGQPAFPIGKATWLNGTPLTEDDLRGKVVLLDFWAVWCGPCIATFPHLREWHEKYHDRGLEIVGITRHYKYGWNEQTNRPQPDRNITPEQEDQATEKFLAFHKLKHRIAVADDQSPVFEQYRVTGIPQAVLVDKKGVIRMIRVGSGEQNARELEKTIEILLNEQP